MNMFILVLAIMGVIVNVDAQTPATPNGNRVERNGMIVSWIYEADQIQFEMEAPTTGWIAIGLNEKNALAGSYLLMGRIADGKAEVVEHYTLAPGDYQPISALGAEIAIAMVSGQEGQGISRIRFTLPILPGNSYAKKLEPGLRYTMHMAYSREDDFQHHSMMRTAANVKL